MSKVLDLGKELVRISPQNTFRLEYSTNGGKTWLLRCTAPLTGGFESLVNAGSELIAITAKGTYSSKTQGRTWVLKGGR